MSQFRQLRMFPSDKSLNLDFKEGEVCVDFIEYAALEAAQKEIEQLKAALKVAEDALGFYAYVAFCGKDDVLGYQEWMTDKGIKALKTLDEIQKIKKGLE